METFRIKIKEVLSRIIEVEALSSTEALEMVEELYKKEEIVLDANDFLSVKIKEYEEKDPRIILSEKLQKIGLSAKEANSIALDAGSSQAIVNRTYLKEGFAFSKEVEAKVLKLVRKFYSGAFNEYEN